MGHRRRQGDAAAAAAPGERALRRRGGGQRRGDAGHDLALDPGLGQGLELFLEPAEHARVAALQPHHHAAFAGVLHQQGVDRRLAGVLGARLAAAVRHAAKAALADVDPARLRREGAQGRVGERIEQHHVGGAQPLGAAQGDQVGLAGAGTDEDDAAGTASLRLHAAERAKRGRVSVHVALVVAFGEETERTPRVGQRLVAAQQRRVEAGARQERQHVDQHLAGGADLAREAVAHAQQPGLAVGAAVDPLREAAAPPAAAAAGRRRRSRCRRRSARSGRPARRPASSRAPPATGRSSAGCRARRGARRRPNRRRWPRASGRG